MDYFQYHLILSLLKLVVRALKKLTASKVHFVMTYLKSRKVKEKRKIQVTGIIDVEPCSKNTKVSVSHVQGTRNSTVSSNKRRRTDLQKSNCPKKSKIYDNNALKPCPKKKKFAVDSNTDNTTLVLPRSKKDNKLIVSIDLKDLKTKFNVKDDDGCSSIIVSIKLSNIKCKAKDDITECVLKIDHCSSSLIVSI
uniref:Uncharacterized protein n=1 Tax=Amphimedon queenslandica TaxID=400682 RepID=A0A1X7UWW8_AMPQE